MNWKCLPDKKVKKKNMSQAANQCAETTQGTSSEKIRINRV